MKYAAFMLLTFTSEWLALSPDERERFNEEVVGRSWSATRGR